MDYTDYQRNVLARCSQAWHNESLDIEDAKEALREFIEAGNRIDRIKKALFYGRPFQWDEGIANIPLNEPIPVPSTLDQLTIHALLGFATEGVEMMEALLGWLDGKGFDNCNLQEEFGDGEWYRALGLYALSQTHEENLQQNDQKLEARFGSVFTEAAANQRDLVRERAVLERRQAAGE